MGQRFVLMTFTIAVLAALIVFFAHYSAENSHVSKVQNPAAPSSGIREIEGRLSHVGDRPKDGNRRSLPPMQGTSPHSVLGKGGGLPVIRGHVVDDTGAPVPSVLMTASPNSVARGHRIGNVETATDQHGYYRIGPVDQGSWKVAATADGYVPRIRETFVADPGEERELNFTLAGGALVEGWVVGTEDAGLPGIWVELVMANNVRGGPTPLPVLSGSDGRFAIGGILPGSYRFCVSSWEEDYSYRQLAQNPPLTLEARQHAEDITVRVTSPEAGIIEGHVRDKTSGEPLGAVKVVATAGVVGVARTETRVGGDFRLVGLSEGTVDLAFTCTGYQEIRLAGTQVGTSSLRVYLPPQGAICGHVYDARSMRPLEEFQVRVVQLLGPDGTSGAAGVADCTAGDGRFLIRFVDPGVATLSVSAFGYARQEISDVTVASGKETELCGYLAQMGSIHGCLTVAGIPSEGGGEVRLTPIDTDTIAMTVAVDEEGHFLLERVAEGRYIVTVRRWFPAFPGSRHASLNSTEVHVRSGEAVWLDFEMGGTAGVRGRISVPEGYNWVRVVVRDAGAVSPREGDTVPFGGTEDFIAETDSVDAGGYYRILDLPAGVFRLTALCGWRPDVDTMPTGTKERSQVVAIEDGQVVELDFTF